MHARMFENNRSVRIYRVRLCVCFSRLPEAIAQREESQKTRTGSAGTRVEAKSSAGRYDQSGRRASGRAARDDR